VYYTDEAIRDVLLHGIADNDIRRNALGAAEIQTKSVANVIALVEGKETARDASLPPATNAASSYRRTQLAKEPNPATPHQCSTHTARLLVQLRRLRQHPAKIAEKSSTSSLNYAVDGTRHHMSATLNAGAQSGDAYVALRPVR
jgi:hypothetical protein